MTVNRTLATAAAAALLAVPVLAACSGGSSGGAASTSVTPTDTATATVTGTPATPSVDATRLTAIAACLKNAGLPTPTSTNVADVAAELTRLAQDPTTAAALRACGIPLPSGASGASGTPSTS